MRIKYIRSGIFLLLLCLLSNVFALNPEEKNLIKAIKAGNVESVKLILKNRTDIDCVFSNGKSGLYYTIRYNQPGITRIFLKKGANPKQVSGKFPLLIWAIIHDRTLIVKYLIEFGANVNRKDKKLNTPLIFAVRNDNMRMCKILLDRGANPNHKNKRGNKASFYAMNWGNLDAKNYIATMEAKVLTSEKMPSMKDGPYIYWNSDKEINMQYYEHKQSGNQTRLIEKNIFYSGNDTIIKGFGWDDKVYHVNKRYRPIPYKINTEAKIFAIGDVHGKYEALIKLLMNNKIIDADKKWIFGKGQLVFLGDLFDRGSMVTELLWFVHELNFEAGKLGGRVILLLGNHEVMTLKGDHRYANQKYSYFGRFTFTNYFELFPKNSVLGKWLRSQGIIVQINDNLFMHAGISPQFNVQNFSFPEINLALQMYLNSDEELKEGTKEDIILSTYGPLWFRGYAFSKTRMSQVPQQFVDRYLSSNGLSRMILGHNEQSYINTSYEGKVVSIDVRIDESGKTAQGLLIDGDKLYRCYSNGKKVQIN